MLSRRATSAILMLALLSIAGFRRPPLAAGDPGIPGASMTIAAEHWLATLDEELKAKALYPFADAERKNWHFVPKMRNGVSLKQMSNPQRRAAHALMRSALSQAGYLKANAIMGLESILRVLESRPGKVAEHRDPALYWITVFGAPSDDAPWGLRVEGHHLSLNFSSVSGKQHVVAPAFYGVNPAEVRSGPHAGLRVLAAEEDLAWELLNSLSEEQISRAHITKEAPRDVLLGPGKDAGFSEFEGLPWKAMTAEQRALSRQIIRLYTDNLRPLDSDLVWKRMKAAGLETIHFAWAGALQAGQGHYYRFHGKTFTLEYDNVQGGANHAHAVWRDPANDFGGDLLRKHYGEEHR